MLVRLDLNKSNLATWMMVFFTAVLIVTGFYTDLFQAPTQINPEMSQYRSLFRPGQILGVKEMVLKNNLGTFHFERTGTEANSPWKMVSPRQLPANTNLLQTILSDLNKVQIRSVHQNDPINIANYSLDSSILQVTLIDSNGKESNLKFGLINPLDNSTYVSLSDQDAIYHIDNITTTLNTLDLANFVDTRIFTFNPEEVVSLTIFRGPKEKKNKNFLIEKKETDWFGQRERTLNSDSVKDYLQQLSHLKSPLILDEVTEELQNEVDKYLEKPAFEMVITDSKGVQNTYLLSGLIRSLPGVKLEKWQHYIIKPSNRKFPYILQKKSLEVFQQSERRLRSFPIKKLFY